MRKYNISIIMSGSQYLPFLQAPAAKRTKKGNNKIISPSLSQPAAEDNSKAGDAESSPLNIPHIVQNVTGSSTELLSNGSLPPLEEVCHDPRFLLLRLNSISIFNLVFMPFYEFLIHFVFCFSFYRFWII